MEEVMKRLQDTLMAADRDGALESVQQLLDGGISPIVILQEGMAAAMMELGRRWNAGEVFLPEVVASAEVFKQCNAIVEPALIASGTKEASSVVVMATVKGDLHDLGKNMVGAMLKTSGFEVHDIGKDVPADKIVAAVTELGAEIVGLSALLTTTVPQQRNVIKALTEAGLRDKVKVMVGGAPVTAEWAKEIAADGFAPNAPEAVKVARQLIGLD